MKAEKGVFTKTTFAAKSQSTQRCRVMEAANKMQRRSLKCNAKCDGDEGPKGTQLARSVDDTAVNEVDPSNQLRHAQCTLESTALFVAICEEN